MKTLQIQNITLAFGSRNILDNISFTLSTNSRAALCGENGAGKSTLLKIIASEQHQDSGNIAKVKGLRVSYLPQSDIVLKDNTVFEEVEKGYSRYLLLIERQKEIEEILSKGKNDINLLNELDEIHQTLLDSGYHNRRNQIEIVLQGLGFKINDLDRSCSEFSGGYQMRISLAKLLIEDPDIMLLDEPTNYLDQPASDWLKDYLSRCKNGIMIVSHDRGFLDSTVNEVYELFNSNLTRYSGNYSQYEKTRREEIQALEKQWEKQEADIKKTEQFIERFRYKATKAKQVQSRIKALEKIDPVIVPSHLKTLHFSFPESPHSPNKVVSIENLTKKYGDKIIYENFNLQIIKKDRLSVTGYNGTGKSTLLKIISGIDTSYSGNVILGPGIKIGYYSQDTADSLNLENTVFEEVSQFGIENNIRNALGSFLFSGDDIYKKINILSGGERSRLALLKILLNPCNLLILDEPTNHLDINAKDMLLEALSNFDGTIILVSHDSYFIDKICTKILYLSDDEPKLFLGDWDYFKWKTDDKERNNETIESTNDNQISNISRKEENKKRNIRRKQEKRLEELQAEITKTQNESVSIQKEMNLPENYSSTEKILKLSEKKEKIEAKISEMETEWIELSELLEDDK